MLTDAVLKEIEAVARRLGVEAAALAAVAEIESGGRSHTVIDGRIEPLIRFEGHYFDRRLAGAKRTQARREGLASPVAGRVANPASQAARWTLLARAEAIDRTAARESVSWGMGQVMGAHWAWLGHASVDELVAEARSGIAGQLRLMERYIAKADLAGSLRSRDWATFARAYNGPGFRANAYDAKLSAAYSRYAARSSPNGVLKRGAGGEAVREFQLALRARGYVLHADGVFGPLTEATVKRFQRDSGLFVDGIAGSATMAALGGVKSERGLLSRLLASIARMLPSM